MSELDDLYPDAYQLLGYAAPTVRPRAALKEKLLERIRRSRALRSFTEAMPGVHILRAEEKDWRPTPYPGVAYKSIYLDSATSMATSLLKFAPGAVYPPHRHTGIEHCLVVEGQVATGDVTIGQGDYEIAMPGSVHSPIRSETGAVLLIISSIHDEMLK